MANDYRVVFDFDGTIIPENIGYQFNKWLIQRSPVRSLLAILLFPLIFLLVINPVTIRLGMNIGCLIATMLQTDSLLRLRSQFIQQYFDSQSSPVYEEAVSTIKRY